MRTGVFASTSSGTSLAALASRSGPPTCERHSAGVRGELGILGAEFFVRGFGRARQIHLGRWPWATAPALAVPALSRRSTILP